MRKEETVALLILSLISGVLVLQVSAQEPAEADPPAVIAPGAEQAGTPAAQLVRVPVPITGTIDTRVIQQISRLVDNWSDAGPRPILAIEFWPPENADQANGTQFGRALTLADFLASDKLQGVQTVAYLPRTIRGHAVLPILACEQIIMHPDATLGEAGIDETEITEPMRQTYLEIADRRRTIPPPVALGMLDPAIKVYMADTAGGVRYVNEAGLEQLQSETHIQSMETIVEVGDLGNFTGKELRDKHSFVSHLAVDRRELAAALNLAIDDLDSDVSLDHPWKAVRASVDGVVRYMMIDRTQRSIDDAIRTGQANLVLLCVDSPGGSPEASLRLANYLSSLDSSQVRTVAYIDDEARADAALIALACDHVVMTPNSSIGGEGMHEPNQEQIDDLRSAVKEFSSDKARRWSLPVALFDPQLAVHKYTLQGTNVAEYFCAEELAEQQDPGRWQKGDEFTQPNKTLVIQGIDAEQLGIARSIVDNEREIQQLYQLADAPAELEPSWVDSLVVVLAKPQVAAMLLFIACFAMIGEISAPGIGIGGFISAVCFVVYFWSQTMNQNAGMLEVLLFLTGVACVLAEIFVIPGFGVFGFGGGLLILVSLVLASQSFVIPQNSYQLSHLTTSLASVLAAVAGILVGLIVMRKYMDDAPFIRRVMLKPPEGEELEELNQRESLVDYAHLLNQQGVTTTPVVPSGKARFGRDVVDVISDGEFLAKGTPVRVVDVQGNRVLIESC